MANTHASNEEKKEHEMVVLPRKQINLIFVALLIVQLASSLGQMVFSTAMPTIVGELGGVTHMLWISTGYILAATITMPIYGKVGDVYGRKPIVLLAVSLFMIGSIVGGLTDSMAQLIVARVIQGLGGGGLMILSQAIIGDVVPPKERGKYMGPMGAVFGISAVAGPLVGGWLTDLGEGAWRWAFWMNVPLSLVAIVALVVWLKVPRFASENQTVDVLGTMLMVIWVTLFVLGITFPGSTISESQTEPFAWSDPLIIGLLAGAFVVAVVFFIVEKYAKNPLMPLYLFANRNFNLVTAASLILGIAMFGAIGYMPTYLQVVHEVSATKSGLMLLPMVAGIMIFSIFSGQIASRREHFKWLILVSPVLVGIGLLVLSTLKVDTSVLVVMLGVFIIGSGLGFGQQIMVLIAQNEFSAEEVGTSTGVNNFFREVGATLGAAIVGSLFTTRLKDLFADRAASVDPQNWLQAAQSWKAAGKEGEFGLDTFQPSLMSDSSFHMPQGIADLIQGVYNDALAPVFLWIAPLMVAALIVVFFVKEKPLNDKARVVIED
ncbi:MAG: MFS transporter [Actinomycetaceae bacterium]|nr:MFS transporter [Actinomycetaceae bacterium]